MIAVDLVHHILNAILAMFLIRFLQLQLDKDSSLGSAISFLFH